MAKRKNKKNNDMLQLFLSCLILVMALLFGVLRAQTLQSHAESNPFSPTLSLNLFLDGIGSSGDSVNPNNGGNGNPLHKTRAIEVEVADTTGGHQIIQGEATYNASTRSFKAVVQSGIVNASGFYVRIKVPGYLKAQTKDKLVYPANNSITVPDLLFIAGDATNDSKLDVSDYSLIRDCFSILVPPPHCDDGKKAKADITDDGLVNHYDYNLFLRELSKHGGEDTSGQVVLTTIEQSLTPTPTSTQGYIASDATLSGGTPVAIGQSIALNDVVSLKITGAMFVSSGQLASLLGGESLPANLIPNGEQVLAVYYELMNTSQVGQNPLQATSMMPFALFDDTGKRIDDRRPENALTAQSTAIITTVPLSTTKGPFLFLIPNKYNLIPTIKLVINNAKFSPVKSIITLVTVTEQP